MKTKVALTLSILGLALAVGFLFFTSPLNAQHQHDEHSQMHKEKDQQGHSDKAKDKKVRCAFDSMLMKASAMTKMSHEGETVYFCNEKQAELFKAHPDKYLKQISLGHLTFNLNLLTTSEVNVSM